MRTAMRFALCNEMYVDWDFERAFAFTRECGYTGIELAPFTMAADAAAIPASQRQQVRAQASAADLEIIGLHWLLAKTEGYYLTSPEAAVRAKTADYFATLAQLCADLGGKVMVLGSPQQRNLLPGITHAEAMKLAADVIQSAVPAFEACDVTLALEPLGPAEGDFLRTAAAGAELMNMIQSPHVQLHLDVKAMSTESIEIPQLIEEHADHLAHFHANDPNLLGPGMGDVDFRPIFAALEKVGYDGWVSVEVFDYSPGVETIARESMANMLSAASKEPGPT